MKAIFVLALVIASALGQQQASQNATSSSLMQPTRTIETFGSSNQLAQPDEFRCIVIVEGKAQAAGGMNQTQPTTGQQVNQTLPTTNQTSAQAAGGMNQTQPTTGQQVNQTLPTSNQTSGQQTGQQTGGQQQALQDISNIINTAQQLAQALQQAGALNATINMVDMIPSMRDPSKMKPVASVLFRGSINQLQQLLQSAFQQGATSISSIRFVASKQSLKQASNLAIQDAVNNAMQQIQLLQQFATQQGGQQSGQTSQSGQAGQNLLNIRVLDVRRINRPSSEEVSSAFQEMFSDFTAWMMQGGRKMRGQQQAGQQQFGQQQSSDFQGPPPAIVAFTPHVRARVAVRSSF